MKLEAGSSNNAADTLSRREQDVNPQEAVRQSLRSKALIKPEQLDERVKTDLGIIVLDTFFPLTERLYGFNGHYYSLAPLRKLVVAKKAKGYILEDGLLLY